MLFCFASCCASPLTAKAMYLNAGHVLSIRRTFLDLCQKLRCAVPNKNENIRISPDRIMSCHLHAHHVSNWCRAYHVDHIMSMSISCTLPDLQRSCVESVTIQNKLISSKSLTRTCRKKLYLSKHHIFTNCTTRQCAASLSGLT